MFFLFGSYNTSYFLHLPPVFLGVPLSQDLLSSESLGFLQNDIYNSDRVQYALASFSKILCCSLRNFLFPVLFCDIPLLIFLGRGKQMLSGVTPFLGRHS